MALLYGCQNRFYTMLLELARIETLQPPGPSGSARVKAWRKEAWEYTCLQVSHYIQDSVLPWDQPVGVAVWPDCLLMIKGIIRCQPLPLW